MKRGIAIACSLRDPRDRGVKGICTSLRAQEGFIISWKNMTVYAFSLAHKLIAKARKGDGGVVALAEESPEPCLAAMR